MERNQSIDCFKFAAAVLIVAIHTGLFSDVDQRLNFFVVNYLCRMAIPFFAVVTGYFLTKKLEFDNKLERNSTNVGFYWKYTKKTAILYVTWSIIYLIVSIPLWIKTGWMSPMAFVDFAIGTLTKGSHYHLWYLLYLIYSLPLFWIVLRTIRQKYLLPIAFLLWMAEIVLYAYRFFLPPAAERLLCVFDKNSTIGVILPLLILGSVIARGKSRSKKFMVVGFIVSAIALLAEAIFLKECGVNAYSYLFFTFPTAYFAFNVILSIDIRLKINSKYTAMMSTIVYCVHPIFVEAFADAVDSSVIRFLITLALSIAVAVLYVSVKNKIKRRT